MIRRGFVGLLLILLSVTAAYAQDTTQQALDEAMQAFNPEGTGAVIAQVTTPDGTWTAVSGLADGERASTAEDRFRIGSMSKTFVAAVALMLAEDGVFSLDDAASTWLPDEVLERIVNTQDVTIRQLLAMRSGIPDYLGTPAFLGAVIQDTSYPWKLEEALAYANDLPALFAPDESYSYSNSNYLLAQLVLEAASEQPLHTLIRERIIEPLALENTYTQISETLDGEFVNGYVDIDGDGNVDEVSEINDGAGFGDGGLVSTVGDLTTFYRALLQERTLLSEAALAQMMTFQDGDGFEYGLGLLRYESEWGDAIGHNGAVIGYLSSGVYLPAHETIIITLSADMMLSPDEFSMKIGEIVLE
jgi:D-alanyl-D-alanine carboxypeptidase